ncbi:MAG TPA: hypothetical protein VKB57_21425 [Acidimicrobiales bacterium]|nr:hypothetical protein [Acidimicrobiales bacterium]
MGKQESKIIEGVRPLLAAGEEPLVAIVAQPKGTTKAAAGAGALGGAGTALGGGERRAASEAAEGAGLVLSSPCAVVLTTQRLLTVKIGAPIGLGLGGKVKDVLSFVPIADVAGVDVKKIAMRQNVTLHVRGESIALEANAAASAQELASTLASLKG